MLSYPTRSALLLGGKAGLGVKIVVGGTIDIEIMETRRAINRVPKDSLGMVMTFEKGCS